MRKLEYFPDPSSRRLTDISDRIDARPGITVPTRPSSLPVVKYPIAVHSAPGDFELDDYAISEIYGNGRVSSTYAEYLMGSACGGSGPEFILADGVFYVTKFLNNIQGAVTLANEYLGNLLAAKIGLPVPNFAVVKVPPEVVRSSKCRYSIKLQGWEPYAAGDAFGSRIPAVPGPHGETPIGAVLRLVPVGINNRLINRRDILGIAVFDKWVCNVDYRQLICVPHSRSGRYYLMMIDQGLCFGGAAWDLSDWRFPGTLIGEAWRLYEGLVDGISSFEPWLSKIEHEIDLTYLLDAVCDVPKSWFGDRSAEVIRMIRRLDERRHKVRSCLEESLEMFMNRPFAKDPEVGEYVLHTDPGNNSHQITMRGIRPEFPNSISGDR